LFRKRAAFLFFMGEKAPEKTRKIIEIHTGFCYNDLIKSFLGGQK